MVERKRNFKGKLCALLLILSLGANAVLLARSWWTNMQSETEIFGLASYAAAMQADADFFNGVRRQYELSKDGKTQYTNRNNGPFEVWSYAYYPILGHDHVFAQQQFVKMYNEKMRLMYQHPEKFSPDGEGGHNATTRPTTAQSQN